jgi:SagB-type dehydrogenase family enzyme
MTQFPGNPLPPPPQWSDTIRDRILRVFEYHQSSKLVPRNAPAAAPDSTPRPAQFRTFEGAQKIALPTNVLNADVPLISLFVEGLSAVPESRHNPSHDLRTLASWLFFANGLVAPSQGSTVWQRTLTSNGETYPCDIWVAAFAVDGLEPGLYYYSPREFALRRLREGLSVLAQLKRGRPDLDFLKTIPATLLISTIFSRSAWRFHKRGYRAALLDTGHLVENLIHAGSALGMQTSARLRINDAATRELIGVPNDVDFDHAETVQAIVSWTNDLPQPLVVPVLPPAPMPQIARPAPAASEITYGAIVQTHQDCVSPGVAIREVRSPLTQLSPLDGNIPVMERVPIEEPSGGRELSAILMHRKPIAAFARKSIPRDAFLAINKLALRRVSYSPLIPDAPHVALVRPIWIVHDVSGFECGLWYYSPQLDRWSALVRGSFRAEAAHLCGDNPCAADCSAVCFFIANIHLLLQYAGPDTYRLAHVEAGVVAHRMQLLAEAQHVAAIPNASFYDDEIRKFFGLATSGWEVISQVFIGEEFSALRDGIQLIDEQQSDEGVWRD